MKTQNRFVTLMAGFVLTLVLSTSTFAGPTEPVKTKYLKTTGAGFNIDQSARAVYYAVNCQIRKKLKAPLYVSIEFENPDKNEAPFIQQAIIKPGQKVFSAESPTFKRIKNKHIYLVVIKLYDDKDRKKLISEHAQQVFFSIPEKLAPGLGIELIK